ncbi:hypothetical protein Nepgr_008747 [Nepenthes gracilis]|uniref:Uncharacterized protein n=1 Tax=Nepenthes gracilis TaxID=150966 RepID=A0AAD3S9G8_NEPGR|nr:hypothetical protein Nepgr_008747 [Nepenthes gracilis]
MGLIKAPVPSETAKFRFLNGLVTYLPTRPKDSFLFPDALRLLTNRNRKKSRHPNFNQPTTATLFPVAEEIRSTFDPLFASILSSLFKFIERQEEEVNPSEFSI